ncbi:MAG: ClpXP protease specificity-enhancing factor SspB [Siculibacillus sp.]|nr:ClpXP protease specificity-enhancing factor SspB [Siculibacillus sp.]
MTQDLIRYDILVQDALRGVVRKVLGEVAKTGLPGDHHFYISFDTNHPGVRLSGRLRQRYPTEMTVILQHQFWDLQVDDAHFEVGLSFGGIPERLYIPFASVKGFVDPSVEFGLQFEVAREEGEEESAEAADGPKLVPVEASTIPVEPPPEKPVEAPPAAVAEAVAEKPVEPPPTATVLSLDKFRKK